jgi:hypothetical protein
VADLPLASLSSLVLHNFQAFGVTFYLTFGMIFEAKTSEI